MDRGAGAYVLSGGWSGGATGAAPYLVDAKGRADPLGGADATSLLGYADVPAPVVPDSWVELFRCGSRCRRTPLQPPSEPKGSACG